MKKTFARVAAGFTLVELMMVVVILGVLAAVAIPSFSRYVRRSKTAEATGNLSKIYMGEVAYFVRAAEESSASFVTAPSTFPTLTPATPPTGSKFPAQPTSFTMDTAWSAIGFAIDLPCYYTYGASGSATAYTVISVGDLDGDGVTSQFQRRAELNGGEIQGSQLIITNEIE